MKTKAYKLAAELGLQEQPVLDWLRANGYPNVRRADMIRADVAQAARKALGRQSGSSRMSRTNAGMMSSNISRHQEEETFHDGSDLTKTVVDGLKVSFADLLESHLPADERTGGAALPNNSSRSSTRTITAPPPAIVAASQGLDVRIARVERERDQIQQTLGVERAKVEGLERLLDNAQKELETARVQVARLNEVRAERERLNQHVAELKNRLRETGDERASLEQACADLQSELADLQEAVGEYDSLQHDHDSVMGDLQTARQREGAWRKRALELERSIHSGDELHTILEEHGLTDRIRQRNMLKAVLSNETAAAEFLKCIRGVDSAELDRLLSERLLPTCVNGLCNKIARRRGSVPYRVDNESRCRICTGRAEVRWFENLVSECNCAGVRRLLVVGGGETVQAELRSLTEGRSIDLRLVADGETPTDAQVQGRVEGCDVVILWGPDVVDPDISAPYRNHARDLGRVVVQVLANTGAVIPFCRSTVNVLARNQALTPV